MESDAELLSALSLAFTRHVLPPCGVIAMGTFSQDISSYWSYCIMTDVTLPC